MQCRKESPQFAGGLGAKGTLVVVFTLSVVDVVLVDVEVVLVDRAVGAISS